MEFKKYQHLERFNSNSKICYGECFIFPKLDGTNGQLYYDSINNIIKAGSRNRELTLDNDNANFYNTIINDQRYKNFFNKFPNHRLYGEWLVSHSIKTYQDSAWRKFYVFDVMIEDEYLDYKAYKNLLEEFNIDYIPCISIMKNPSYEDLIKCLDMTNYLIQDGKGLGEGIVIKNYEYRDAHGRIIWEKIIRNEFKEQHIKTMLPIKQCSDLIEEKIVTKYVTKSFIEKEYYKIITEKQEWSNKYIPMLFGKVFYELINEEMWNIIKEFKSPVINFTTLNYMCIQKIKQIINI